MIAVVIVIRWRKILHVSLFPATISILELLTLGCLSRVAAICGFVGVRVRDLVAMTCFHFGALPLIVAIQRTRIPLDGDDFAIAM
jgi:hypothetical protein